MGHFSSRDEVRHALEHYLLRPSKMTGKQLSEHTAIRNRIFMTDDVKDVFCTDFRDGDFMRAVDRALEQESKSHRTVGIATIAQVANYYGIISDKEYSWWSREARRRYKPNKTVAERIIPKDNLKKYFDSLLELDLDSMTNARLYIYSALLLLTGARQKAIINLKMSDISISQTECTLQLTRLKSAQSSKQVIHIPLDTPLPNGRVFAEPLYAYLTLRATNEYFFVDVLGVHGPGLFMSCMHHMRRHGHYSGIGHITPHMFRFTTASIVSDHVGIKQAQYLLGHSDIKTTMRYASLQYENTSRSSISTAFNTLSANGYGGAQ
jgi:integrase